MKFPTRTPLAHRSTPKATYRPRMETLEDRLQPGEAFLAGLAAQLALTEPSFALLDPETPALVEQDGQREALRPAARPEALESPPRELLVGAASTGTLQALPETPSPSFPSSAFPPAPQTAAALPTPAPAAADLLTRAAAAPQASPATAARLDFAPPLTRPAPAPLVEEVESVAGAYGESGVLTPDADPPEVRVRSVHRIEVPRGPESVTLDWSTYVGSFLYDTSNDVVATPNGLYIAGATMGFDFITRPVVAAFDLSASAIILAVIDFEGAYFSSGSALAVDDAGNMYLAGDTDVRFPGVTTSGFALRLNADFVTVDWRLTYSGQPGAGNTANLRDIAVNAAGTQVWMTGGLNVVVSDRTDRGLLVGRHNAVTGQQLNGRWHRLAGSGFFTPAGASEGFGLAVNAQGISYVAGAFLDLSSADALTQSVCLRLNTDLTLNEYRYFTNNGIDLATSVVLDGGSNPYLTGAFSRPDGSGITNLMLAKFNAALTSTTYGFSYRNANDAYLLGSAVTLNSLNQPILLGTILEGKDSDALLYRMSTANPPTFLDGARLGGTSYDLGGGVATGPAGAVYVTGLTISLDFPTTPGVVQPYPTGFGDGYLTKLTVA